MNTDGLSRHQREDDLHHIPDRRTSQIPTDELGRPPWAIRDPMLRHYYDTEWGMPIRDERGLFERISLEAFQAGLAWSTILRKRDAFRRAFDDFEPEIVSEYGEADVERLLSSSDIVRNERKIRATITNARVTLRLRVNVTLPELIWSFQPATTPEPSRFEDIPSHSLESVALAKELRRRGFVFVGPTTMFALMQAVGIIDTHLTSSHRRGTSGIWRTE